MLHDPLSQSDSGSLGGMPNHLDPGFACPEAPRELSELLPKVVKLWKVGRALVPASRLPDEEPKQ